MINAPLLTIKEIATRTGLTAAQLRQWERRYGFPKPQRTEGGQRLFSEQEFKLIVQVAQLLEQGVSTQQAIEHVRSNSKNTTVATAPHRYSLRLKESLLSGNFSKSDGVLSEAFQLLSFDEVVLEVMADCLRSIGEDWHDGLIGVAQEHMCTQYLKSRLFELFRMMGDSLGPRVVVGVVPGEVHYIGAMMMAVYLKRAGCSVFFVGNDAPLTELELFCQQSQAQAVVMSCLREHNLNHVEGFGHLAPVVVVGGIAAQNNPKRIAELGAHYLGNHPPDVAERVFLMVKELA